MLIRIVWARGRDVYPALTDMRALPDWTAANPTDGYRQNNGLGYLVGRPSDGQFTRILEAFTAVLEGYGDRPVPGFWGQPDDVFVPALFATQSLPDGVPITMIEENMGNSERMIRDTYAHVITDLRSGQLSGNRPNFQNGYGWQTAGVPEI